MRIPVILLF